jgi:pyruvate, water dikinase
MQDTKEQMLDLPKEKALVLKLQEVGLHEIHLVGGKNASLGEMIQRLQPQGIKVPIDRLFIMPG